MAELADSETSPALAMVSDALERVDNHLDAINGDKITDPNQYHLLHAVRELRRAVGNLRFIETTRPDIPADS